MEYVLNEDPVGGPDADGVVTIRPNLWLLTPDEMPPILFTPEEVARVLNVGRHKVYDLMRANALRSIKVGGSRRISAKSLAQYVDALDAAASA